MRYAFVVATLIACSPAPANTAADTSSTAPAPAAGMEFPTGTYTGVIQPSEIADTSLATNAGSWRLNFAPGGALTVTLNDSIPIATATYTVTGHQIVVTAGNAAVCQGLGGGVFRWTHTDSTLGFTAIEDKCPDRRLVFTLKPMRRQ